MGLVHPRTARKVVEDLLESISRADLIQMVPRWSPFLRSYVQAFTNILDRASTDQEKHMWLEKSPRHLDHTAEISRWIAGVRFIHLVRDGRDVVASLFELGVQDPRWLSRIRQSTMVPRNQVTRESIMSDAVRRWNLDVQETLRWAHKPDHVVVWYEQLIEDAEAELRRVCDHMNVRFEPGMLRFWEAASQVVGSLASAPHMQGPFSPLADTRGIKFRKLFTEAEQRRITRNLLWGGVVPPLN